MSAPSAVSRTLLRDLNQVDEEFLFVLNEG